MRNSAAANERRLLAAGAGAHFQDGIALIGLVLGQQGDLHLLVELGSFCLTLAQLLLGHGLHLGIAGGIGRQRREIVRSAWAFCRARGCARPSARDRHIRATCARNPGRPWDPRAPSATPAPHGASRPAPACCSMLIASSNPPARRPRARTAGPASARPPPARPDPRRPSRAAPRWAHAAAD